MTTTPQASVREPGREHLHLAGIMLVFVNPEASDAHYRKTAVETLGIPVVVGVTSREILDQCFPQTPEGSLYRLFANANTGTRACFLCADPGQREEAIREAALGLMDNPLFHGH